MIGNKEEKERRVKMGLERGARKVKRKTGAAGGGG